MLLKNEYPALEELENELTKNKENKVKVFLFNLIKEIFSSILFVVGTAFMFIFYTCEWIKCMIRNKKVYSLRKYLDENITSWW